MVSPTSFSVIPSFFILALTALRGNLIFVLFESVLRALCYKDTYFIKYFNKNLAKKFRWEISQKGVIRVRSQRAVAQIDFML